MSEYAYSLWVGDSDDLIAVLQDKNGFVDLTNASSIKAVFTEVSGSPVHEITNLSGDNKGTVPIPVTPTETGTAGTYKLRIPVTISGKQYTFPSAGPLYVKVNKP